MTAKLEALAEKLDASERKCALSEEAFNQEADRSESLQKQVQREKEVVANLTEKITEKDAKIEGLETRLDGKVNADAFDAEESSSSSLFSALRSFSIQKQRRQISAKTAN